jgi:hypothetical protein
MSTQANTVARTARTAKEREDVLFALGVTQGDLAKAIQHISVLADSAHPLIAHIWRDLERAQAYITRAQSDVRVEPYIPDTLDDAA